MYYKKFTKDGVIHNTIVTHPEYEFFINNKKVYLNKETEVSGDFSNKVRHIPQGSVSITEMNINRPDTSLVKPFFVYDGVRENMFNIGTFPETGTNVDGQYPMSASISRIYYDKSATTSNLNYIHALRNPIELSGELSIDNNYENISGSDANIIAIPSIFYGSGLKKGSIKMNFYVNGTLTANLEDTYKNGKLYNTLGSPSGSVAGIALYDYGLLILTSSTSLHGSHTDNYGNAGSSPSWLSFGSGINEISASIGSNQDVSATPSYSVYFKGTNKVPTMTLMAHAEMGECNYSFNPTYVDKDTPSGATATIDSYIENKIQARNIRKSKYENFNEEYENITYISQIGIYDKDKNLIGIAKLANPVKKTEIQDYMFKLRLDF